MEFKDWLNLNEIFDTPVPYQWIEEKQYQFEAEFQIKDKKYTVTFYNVADENIKNRWEIFFEQIKPNHSMGKTRTGDAGQVFATVLAIIKDFENKVKPNGLSFEGSGKSRNDLYQKMLKKYLPPQYTKTQLGSLFSLRRAGA